MGNTVGAWGGVRDEKVGDEVWDGNEGGVGMQVPAKQ